MEPLYVCENISERQAAGELSGGHRLTLFHLLQFSEMSALLALIVF